MRESKQGRFVRLVFLIPISTALFLSDRPVIAAADCADIGANGSLVLTVAPAAPGCFLVTIPEGQMAQVSVEQPEDLKLHVTAGAGESIVDGFQFGPETVTFPAAGPYRVEVRSASTGARPLRVSVTRTIVLPDQASAWQKAEAAATHSKASPDAAGITESLNLWKELRQDYQIARTLLKDGDLKFRDGAFASAVAPYEEALRLCQSLSEYRCAGEAANNSGIASSQTGSLDEAADRLGLAADYWKKIGDRTLEGRTLSNLGLLYRRAGDYRQAIDSYDRARTLLEGGDKLVNGRVLNNLGVCYLYLAEYDRGAAYLQIALRSFIALNSAADVARARINLGRARLLSGAAAQSLPPLNQAVKDAADGSPERADALNNLGQALLRLGRLDEAQRRLGDALKIHEALADKRGQASALHYLGLVSAARSNIDAARRFLTQAIELRRNWGLRDDLADSLIELAQIEHRAGNASQSGRRAEQALDALELVRADVPGAALKASYYSRRRRLFDLLVDSAMESSGPGADAAGLLAAERGRARALLDLLSTGSLLPGNSPAVLDRRARIQKQIGFLSAQLLTASAARETQLRERLNLLIAEDEGTQARLSSSGGMARFSKPLESIEELQKTLPSDTALLEYYLGETRSYLWMVRRSNIRSCTLPPRTAIEEQVERVAAPFGQILERSRSLSKRTSFNGAVADLSATLLGCLKEGDLPARLVIAPDSVLNRVPFAALWIQGSDRIGLSHDLTQVPAATFLLAGRRPRPVAAFPQSILAVADPVFSATDKRAAPISAAVAGKQPAGAALPRLLFNRDIETIEAIVPPSRMVVLRGLDSSVDRVVKMPLSDFAILHFSSHAIIDDRMPEISRVALSAFDREGHAVDGFLRPYQWSTMHLDGSTVVLSACNTALGKEVAGEGLAGFATSLFQAGAAELVLTITEADAEASAEFLSEAYRHLLGPEQVSLEHSLNLVRRQMAASDRWKDPYYWASFIVVGRPGDVR
jgi:CHAT domain-containing protein/Tfp pilus assembly protein PilF